MTRSLALFALLFTVVSGTWPVAASPIPPICSYLLANGIPKNVTQTRAEIANPSKAALTFHFGSTQIEIFNMSSDPDYHKNHFYALEAASLGVAMVREDWFTSPDTVKIVLLDYLHPTDAYLKGLHGGLNSKTKEIYVAIKNQVTAASILESHILIFAHETKHFVQLKAGEQLVDSSSNLNYARDRHEIEANIASIDVFKALFPERSIKVKLRAFFYNTPEISSYRLKWAKELGELNL